MADDRLLSALWYTGFGLGLVLGLLLAVGAGVVDSQGAEVDDAALATVGSGFTYQGHLQLNGSSVDDTCDDGFHVQDVQFDGFQVQNAGDHGVEVNGAGDDGIHVSSATDLAGYFNGDVTINGTCSGCAVATFGVNSASSALQPGDVVTSRDLRQEKMLAETTPVLLEVGLARSGDSVVGVVQGWAGLDGDAGAGEDEGRWPNRLPPWASPWEMERTLTARISGCS